MSRRLTASFSWKSLCVCRQWTPVPRVPSQVLSYEFFSPRRYHLAPNDISVPELTTSTEVLAAGIMKGDYLCLSRAITLCESSRPDHRGQAAALLQHLVSESRHISEHVMFRIGITGPPGAGKSSLIEKLGGMATAGGETVGVLAIDPSSEQSGGSILGDKTRMLNLARDPKAFVRPTPSRGHIGGIARNTADAAVLCEAAGCNVLMVETVGGGQADVAVADVADLLLLVLPPAGGDQLQGIKKGVVEVADVVVVNKADGALLPAAKLAAMEYRSAIQLSRPRSKSWTPPVLTCSAFTGDGLEEVWTKIHEFKAAMAAAGELHDRRSAQRRRLLWSNVKHELVEKLKSDAKMKEIMAKFEERVVSGSIASRAAAFVVANDFFNGRA